MRQTKPFIVEIKPSRKLKAADGKKPSIWGKMDLRPDDDTPESPKLNDETAAMENGDRR